MKKIIGCNLRPYCKLKAFNVFLSLIKHRLFQPTWHIHQHSDVSIFIFEIIYLSENCNFTT